MSDPTSYHQGKLIKIDENSFFQLYETYWKKLYQVALKYLGDHYRAEEVVQEIFTSLWQRKDTLLLSADTVENYLIRAVRFKISRIYTDEIRKTQKLDEFKQLQQEASNQTEKQVLYSFLQADVDKLVDMLPDRCKGVYLLSRVKGLNNKEIAVDLFISEKTVENQLTKALNFLRGRLKKYPRN
ncbi:RNA polymerase sigma-70 factor [Pedobacter sp. MR2016-24]|uniref:RNA polymerase sigma-70 factor n=1 Tax=Pedobacter sp. MR2016-24 TaxID=2994466 RepID=UPI002247E5CB|nr:RNA polymerase sigma-70 factor [Pedobacter sp. MR2016-24]MCX2484898.1 RNA polymerase sigma-70 factor [Pedobacter sp. MR2016-24]